MRQTLPQRAIAWERFAMVGVLVMIAVVLLVIPSTALLLLLLLLGFVAIGQITRFAVRNQEIAQSRLRVIDELMRLRRWPEATAALRHLMSRPAANDEHWLVALGHWASLRLRYHEFEPAGVIVRHMLGDLPSQFPHPIFTGPMAVSLRTMLAWSLLRLDRLVDFDEELSRTRKQIREIESEFEPDQQPLFVQRLRAELTLLEMYRDVVTHHPSEAVALFNKHKQALRHTLGARFGCGLALLAHARLALGQAQLAQQHFADATLLVPEVELRRLYPALTTDLTGATA